MNETAKKTILNAGSGVAASGRLPTAFSGDKWAEIRLDIDPATRPDIVSSFVDMRGKVEDGRFDALYSSHAVEHLFAHEVIPAFREFRRVLKPNGFALVTCPDLTSIARHLLDHGAETIAYESPAGPIRPIDMLFGHSLSIAQGRVMMAHRTGFTAPRLARVALESGFGQVRIMEGGVFDLWAILLCPNANVPEIAPIFAGTDLARLFNEPSAKDQAPAMAGAPAPGAAPV